MNENEQLKLENKKLKEEVEMYLREYENILTEKILLEQEYENYKESISEKMKIKNQGIYRNISIYNDKTDKAEDKSEIDEISRTIWELEANLSLKDEEIRILEEKNKQLENELNLLKEKLNDNSNIKKNNESNLLHEEENENSDELDKDKSNDASQSIFNMKDLYRSTVLKKKNEKIKNKIKESTIVKNKDDKNKNKVKESVRVNNSEEDFYFNRKDEEEIKRREEEEFERKTLEEKEKKKKFLEEEQKKKELEKKIKEFDNNKQNLEKKFEEIKKKCNNFYKELQNQDIYIENYNNFVNELSEEINKLKDKLNISSDEENIKEGKNKINIKIIEFTNSLEIISNKIIQLSTFIDDSKKVQLKNAESIMIEIQDKINRINNEKNNINLIFLKNIYEINNDFISNKLSELETIIESLESNKKAYENSKKSIEEDKSKLKNDITEYIEKVEKSFKLLFEMNNQKKKKGPLIDSIFLKGSMLLGVQDFGKVNDIFRSTYIFKKEAYDNYEQQELLRQNWNEICYVYEEYDIHDVNFDLKAVGLPPNTFFTSFSMGFDLNSSIEILEIEKNKKKAKFNYKSHILESKIKLQNLQSIKIHLKYKESNAINKMTVGEKKASKFIKNKYYGLPKSLAGQKAKFILSIKCNFEVIAFDDEFFIKTNEKEYTWGGKVPPNGKMTCVRMSKPKGKFNFLWTQVIKSETKLPIKNTKMTVPVAFVGGNNEIIKFDCKSEQTDNITLKQEERVYEVNFFNTNSLIGEFKIQGQLINKCKGQWFCDLTDEQIENEIPIDYKNNKETFKNFAQEIIKNYDKENKDDLIKILDVVKIGKWVNKNIKYDFSFIGRRDLTASDILKIRKGVCAHFTEVFNALIYSLGYQVMYVSGYALDKKDVFGREDAHAWSLIKIDGKWLPFDSTWGLFSGKLPVSHIFKQFFKCSVKVKSIDKIKLGEAKEEGKFIGIEKLKKIN